MRKILLFSTLLLTSSAQGYNSGRCYLVNEIDYNGLDKLCRYECEDGTRTVRKNYVCQETITKQSQY